VAFSYVNLGTVSGEVVVRDLHAAAEFIFSTLVQLFWTDVIMWVLV
jgi:hypothetical protein